MVYYQDAQLDLAFAALADPTRRAIVDRLAREPEATVSEIAAPFAVSLPAVMKHLDVLARANLIARDKSGRTVRCRLKPAPMETAMQWLSRYERFWTEKSGSTCRLRRGGTMLTKPSLTLKRRLKASPAQVFAAWTDPQKIVHWFGPTRTTAGSVRARWMCARAAATPCASRPTTANPTRSAASTARSCRTAGWCSAGPGNRRRSASRSSRSQSPPTATAACSRCTTSSSSTRRRRDGHERGWTGTLEKLERFLS